MSFMSQLKFQDAASQVMNKFHHFHKYIMAFLMFIMMLMIYSLMLLTMKIPTHRKLTEKQQMELWWTISPSFILIALAIPSLKLLYWMDEGTLNPNITMKTMGHQWYWTYEMWDEELMEMDSYMLKMKDIPQSGLPRLLEVDNRLTLPLNTDIRIITYSTDVIHAWSVPQLGLKMDAVPGRLNQMFINLKRSGLFYGQCSEICGLNHSFMPMVIESVPQEIFYKWCSTKTS